MTFHSLRIVRPVIWNAWTCGVGVLRGAVSGGALVCGAVGGGALVRGAMDGGACTQGTLASAAGY
jgi:hypothetical protein